MPEPTEAGIQTAFADLSPNWYTSADLLPVYNEWAKREGNPEVTAKEMGEALHRDFSDAPVRRVRGRAIRYLDQDVLQHRAWFRKPDTPPSNGEQASPIEMSP